MSKKKKMSLFKRKVEPIKKCSTQEEKEIIEWHVGNCLSGYKTTTQIYKELIQEAFEVACYCKHSRKDKFERADRLKTKVKTGIKNVLEALDEIDDTTNRKLYNCLANAEIKITTKTKSITDCVKDIENSILSSSFSTKQIKIIKKEITKYLKKP